MRTIRSRAAIGAAIVTIGVLTTTLVASESPAEAVRPLAKAVLHDATGTRIGTVTFSGSGRHAERVRVELSLPSNTPALGGYHGLHVHTTGDCTPPFTSAGGHWNMTAGATHGSHTGDLPSILIAPDGTASTEFKTHRFDVTQLVDADGSAIVLHAGADNFGNVPISPDRYADPNGWYNATGGTASTGDAGGRYGCGVVRRS